MRNYAIGINIAIQRYKYFYQEVYMKQSQFTIMSLLVCLTVASCGSSAQLHSSGFRMVYIEVHLLNLRKNSMLFCPVKI